MRKLFTQLLAVVMLALSVAACTQPPPPVPVPIAAASSAASQPVQSASSGADYSSQALGVGAGLLGGAVIGHLLSRSGGSPQPTKHVTVNKTVVNKTVVFSKPPTVRPSPPVRVGGFRGR